MKKLLSNTTLGHLVVHLVTVFVLAGAAAVLNDPRAASTLVSVGLPLGAVNAVINLLRNNVPNL